MTADRQVEEALRYMGMAAGQQDEEIGKEVKAAFHWLEKKAQPRFVYRSFAVTKQAASIHLEGTSCSIQSRDLCKLLAKSERCVLLAATLGIHVDQEIARRQRTSMLEAMTLDACASVIIDQVCDEAEQMLMKELEPNTFLTMRFSPGYGDVPLEASEDILKVLDATRRIGLTLTSSHMLVPTKSITALIGISSKVESRQRSCTSCHLAESCSYRKRGEQCGL